MKNTFVKYLCGAILAALLCTGIAHPQTVTGSITGQVTDSTGAVLPGATVIAHNVATSVDSTATTNDTGNYSIRFLPVGQYELSVSANGFASLRFPPFALEVDQTVKLDAKLKIGEATTTTVVEGSVAPILNTNDSSLGVTLTNNEVNNIPLNGRNFSSVTLFIPGAVSTNPTGTSGNNAIERSTYYTDIPSVNGNRSQANNYTLDGINMNEDENNLIAYNPAPDAIQELKVITSNAPAEYGNVNGGDVVAVLKSGTNQFHGSAYAYLQNENLNANTWSNNHQPPKVLPDGSTVPNPIPINPYTQTQFGGTLGGPIKRDKLFFFVDYEGARKHTGGTSTATVLTPAMRTGDFSALLNPPTVGGQTNAPVQLYDTQNNSAPYVNNQIPVLNPVAQFLFANPSLYPLPNAAPTDGIAANNFRGPNRTFVVNNQGDVKIEWDPRNADKITGFFSQSDAYDGNIAVLAISFPAQNSFPTKLGGGMWVHVFSPSIVNSARLGFTRVVWNQGIPTDPTGQFGTGGNAKVGIPFGAQQYVGFSYQNISNSFSGVGTPALVGSLTDNAFSYGDNLTWQRGKHLLSMGVEAIRYQDNYITSNNQGFLGAFVYNGDFTRNPSATAVNSLGYGPADFVLDRVASASVEEAGELVGQRQWRAAGFFQDDWKIFPNLTLNLGLRYEYDQPWFEVNNKTGNVDLSNGNFLYAGSIPASAPAGSQLCSNRACYNANYNQWMPRVGFAFQATDRFVVRGGYGATSFFEGNAGNQRLTSLPPFILASTRQEVAPGAATATTPYSPGQPYAVQDGFSNSSSNINYNNSGGSYGAWPLNMRPAYIQEWSLTTEYALTHVTSLQVGYLGEQGQHLIDYRNANQLLINGDQTSFPAVSANPLIGSGSLLLTEPRAMMNYNALQATLRQRASHGLEYTINYTYAKSMTNSLGNYALNVNGYSGAFQNGYNSHADYGPAGYDVRHNLSAVGVYALPFGRGKQFGGHLNRVVDEFVGGWSLSGSLVAYTGFPETITAPNVSNSNTFGQQRANQYRKLKIVGRNINNWWGTDPSATPCAQGVDNGICAYGVPANNSFGTASNGSERGPGYWQIDNSIFKDFHITERHTIGFRADSFNTFNVASYGNPDVGVTDSNFGNISNQGSGAVRSPARNLQLNLHYTF
jgi:Carboxypeptidase regulatory-like domain